MDDKALARTFDDKDQVEVEVLSVSQVLGLCKCRIQNSERLIVRHKVQLTPLNEAAKALLR
jgi:hypothetical protein